MQLTETIEALSNKISNKCQVTMTKYISRSMSYDAINGKYYKNNNNADAKCCASKLLMQSMYSRCQVHHKKI